MVVTLEDIMGLGGTARGGSVGGGSKDFIGPPYEPPTEDQKEKAKEIISQFKHLWPLLLLPLAKWLFDRRGDKNGDLAKSVDVVALVRLLGAYEPYIVAMIWVILSRFSDTIRNLSITLVGAESIPTLDLNLPQGVMLGSWLVTGDYAVDFIANTKEDVAELIETGKTSDKTGPLDILIATIIQVTGLG